MCTAGFWKDSNGTKFYFKNRDNDFKHKNERYEVTDNGVFICDDDGKFEGMNRHGIFIVGLTLVPHNNSGENFQGGSKINHEVLTGCFSAAEALRYIMDTYKDSTRHALSWFLGDAVNSYYIEIVPGNIAVADVSNAPFSVHTNHGILLFAEGIQEGPIGEWSIQRLAIAQEFLKQATSVQDIKAMLKSHCGGKNSICGHGLIYTQSSYIFCPQQLYGEILIGDSPCHGEYTKVNLQK